MKIIVLVFILVNILFSKESITCPGHYDDVKRQIDKVDSYGSTLSKMAEEQLYSDLEYYTKLCISACDGEKFKYCNSIAKRVESHNK